MLIVLGSAQNYFINVCFLILLKGYKCFANISTFAIPKNFRRIRNIYIVTTTITTKKAGRVKRGGGCYPDELIIPWFQHNHRVWYIKTTPNKKEKYKTRMYSCTCMGSINYIQPKSIVVILKILYLHPHSEFKIYNMTPKSCIHCSALYYPLYYWYEFIWLKKFPSVIDPNVIIMITRRQIKRPS